MDTTLEQYACELFDAEAKRYPNGTQLLTLLPDLAGRIEVMVMKNLADMEKGSPFDVGLAKGSLTYHATWDEMRTAIRAALTKRGGRGLKKPDTEPLQKAIAGTEPATDTSQSKQKRFPATITSPRAARRLEAFLESKGIGQTAFAIQANTSDRTLRRFRKTGTLRRDIFERVAKEMSSTIEELMK